MHADLTVSLVKPEKNYHLNDKDNIEAGNSCRKHHSNEES
jgi:lipocalin